MSLVSFIFFALFIFYASRVWEGEVLPVSQAAETDRIEDRIYFSQILMLTFKFLQVY